jgi:uncharacterized RDD family membrane protein YckC
LELDEIDLEIGEIDDLEIGDIEADRLAEESTAHELRYGGGSDRDVESVHDTETGHDFEADYYLEDDVAEDADEADDIYEEEIDDLAPLTMRFHAGVLDLIVGGFTSLLILSPFIITGGQWLSTTGLVAFGLTLAFVMFIYMTASVGFAGRTLGMKMIGLEMIDVEENEYPNFHQAALSSSLYLVSLGLGGVGFATALFNPEKRAMHDLLSGTIIVREY